MSAISHRETSAESITKLVQKHEGNDFSDLRTTLLNDYQHHPQLYAKDLQAATEALHKSGVLPGDFTITGIDGQDFVTRDKDGKVGHRSASNLSEQQDVAGAKTVTIGGRTANLAADGSGTVTAKDGDQKWQSWGLAKDVLQAQGISNPSDNEVANFALQLKKLNGHIRPGQEIKVPGRTKDGDQSSFSADPADATDPTNPAVNKGDGVKPDPSKIANPDDQTAAVVAPSVEPVKIDSELLAKQKNIEQVQFTEAPGYDFRTVAANMTPEKLSDVFNRYTSGSPDASIVNLDALIANAKTQDEQNTLRFLKDFTGYSSVQDSTEWLASINNYRLGNFRTQGE